jgi:ribosomal-protein-serine acetyltransferase
MFKIKIDSEVHLELAHPSHAKEVFEIVNRNRELFGQWFLWVEHTESVEDSRKFLEGTLKEYANQESITCMVFYCNQLVGNVSLFDIGKGYGIRGAEIGYWLDAKIQGKGIIHRAVKKMLDIGFNEYELDKIYIRCDVPNKASAKVAKKLSFIHEGRLRASSKVNGIVNDMDIYGLLREEYLVK